MQEQASANKRQKRTADLWALVSDQEAAGRFTGLPCDMHPCTHSSHPLNNLQQSDA